MPMNYVPWEEAPYTAANRKRRAAEAKAWEEKLAAAANSDQMQDPNIIFVSNLPRQLSKLLGI